MKFKLLLLSLLLTALCASTISAQDQQHELGLQLRSFNDFTIIYKKKRAENKFTRFRIGSVNASFRDSQVQGFGGDFTGRIQFSMGWENRKLVADKVQFYNGFEPRISISYSEFVRNNSADYSFLISPGLGYVLGFQYLVSEEFVINLETIPALVAGFDFNNDDSDSYHLGAAIDMSHVALGLLYRF